MTTLLGIGDFSRMTFLSVTTLRHYHEVGLLTPAEVDPETGYRRYLLEQVATAQVIRRLRELGMSLDEVHVVIDAPDVAERNAAISAHLRRMEGELEQTRETVASLRRLLDEEVPAAVPVEYRVTGPSDALAIRAELAYADAFEWLADAFAELRYAADEGGAGRTGPDAALLSNELLEQEFGELVAIVPVDRPETSQGRVARARVCRGSSTPSLSTPARSTTSTARTRRSAVVAERAIGVQGPIREDYVVGAAETSDVSLHRTEVGWPVCQTTPAR